MDELNKALVWFLCALSFALGSAWATLVLIVLF